MSSIMKQGGVVLAMGKKKMSRAVIQLSLGVDVVGNLLWLAVRVAMGLSVGVDVECDLIGFAVVEFSVSGRI